MYALQKRKSPTSQWRPCYFRKKRCNYEYLPQAWAAIRKQKNLEENLIYPQMEFRIVDTETGKVVE